MNDQEQIPNPFQLIYSELKEIKRTLHELSVAVSSIAPANSSREVGGIALAQEITGLARPTIYGKVSARQIPHSKRDGRLYFSRKELLQWIDSGKRKTIKEIEAII